IRNLACSGIDTNSLRVSATLQPAGFLATLALKDVDGIYFKGDTALQKIFLHYARLSEDIDYTVTEDIKKISSQIIKIVEDSGIFEQVTVDKEVDGFKRLLVHHRGFSEEKDVVFIDLNERATLIEKPETHEVPHFYEGFIPEFSVNTLAQKELFAEKLAAAIGRNKPRDHFDVYMLIKNGYTIDLALAEKKCRQSGYEFDVVKMFNKAKRLHKRWDQDMLPLLAEEVAFTEVMKTLAKIFDLKSKR
ncbi:nucleotidyl transferase AbiEii/AbiGii toxin family protein, partial [Candidatus Woesearchaeota archaeon]|nr:nucleotidyl transferase AbiEii/AbiGii toxin family protein [Candidatus Woesearchaeota archaeon]